MARLTYLDRLAVHDRQRGRCAACERPLGNDVHVHHRRLRSQGGTDDAANLIAVHSACHNTIHRHPARSYECGLLVPSWADPADVMVRPLPVPATA